MSKPIKIREVIQTLCQLFESHGYPKLQAEVIRQAKFDQKDALLPLLEFISSVLLQGLEDYCERYSPFQKFKLILSILVRLKYPRVGNLYCSELHMASSQELLLAFGYLLQQFNVFEYLEYSARHLVTNKMINDFDKSSTETLYKEMRLNQIIRQSKQIEFTWRDLMSSLEYLKKLLNQFNDIDKSEVSKYFNPKDSENPLTQQPRVSLLDLIFFENLRLQGDCITLLKKQNELLRVHLKWVRHESLFWKWLASVNQSSKKCDFKQSDLKLKDQYVDSVPYHVEQVLKEILLRTVFHPQSSPRSEEKKKHTSFRLKDVEEKIKILEEDNKKWLTKYLYDNFPCVIQLPSLRR